MNEVARIDPGLSVVAQMADRFKMHPQNFEAALRATVVPADCSPAQFAAFLIVAREYNLNPITKEIFAFPNGKGIQPIVSIDGWMKLMNSRPEFDGLQFEDHFEDGKLHAITAKVYRRDRTHPVEVTEYLSECYRDTPTWKKWPARMLRHKAAIQAARYAFGFAGIMEPDEAERAVEAQGEAVGAPKRISASRAKKSGVFERMAAEIQQCRTTEELHVWMSDNENAIAELPRGQAGDWGELIHERWSARFDVLAANEEPAQ
jgi:phage recombination protein Bet